jgi:hypothetical protein
MWVSVVLGFDQDGQLVHLWREAFQRHGELVGEFTCEVEYVKDLRRHTMVGRLRKDGADVLPPLTDAVVRVVRGKSINASGIASDGMVGKWRAQAWRMEIVSLEQPDIGTTAPTDALKKALAHESS